MGTKSPNPVPVQESGPQIVLKDQLDVLGKLLDDLSQMIKDASKQIGLTQDYAKTFNSKDYQEEMAKQLKLSQEEGGEGEQQKSSNENDSATNLKPF